MLIVLPCIQATQLPKPFPIPKFRAGTDKNLESKVLTDTDRKYIVQTLATMLMTHIQRPSLQHCGVVAKALVTMYKFLEDNEGDGEVQYKHIFPCINVIITS